MWRSLVMLLAAFFVKRIIDKFVQERKGYGMAGEGVVALDVRSDFVGWAWA